MECLSCLGCSKICFVSISWCLQLVSPHWDRRYMPYHPGAKKETWLPLSHFLELQVVAASLKSMLGLEEVKAWSRCFLFLNSEFEELMRDPMDILWIRFFCRQVSTYPYWVPILRECHWSRSPLGSPHLGNGTSSAVIVRCPLGRNNLAFYWCTWWILVIWFSLVYLWQYTVLLLIGCRCTANQQLPCHLCPRNSCV